MKKTKKLDARYEVRTISKHFGPTISSCHISLNDAFHQRDMKLVSQDLPVIVWDSVTNKKVDLNVEDEDDND